MAARPGGEKASQPLFTRAACGIPSGLSIYPEHRQPCEAIPCWSRGSTITITLRRGGWKRILRLTASLVDLASIVAHGVSVSVLETPVDLVSHQRDGFLKRALRTCANF